MGSPAAAIPAAGGDRPLNGHSAPPGSAVRPPAPPPPPGWSPAAAAASAAAEATQSAAPAPRRHDRHPLGGKPPARIALTNRQPVFVTLNDISPGGCCIVRKGQLELANGDTVVVDIWTQEIETKLSIHARVCWCSHEEATSRAGLRFIETNHRLLRQIDAYVQHFQRPLDESRPQPRLPGPAELPETPPLPARPEPAAAPLPARHHRGEPLGPRARGSGDLRAMPRPPRLNTLDLPHRIGPAHRQEVAGIAEETGIHIHTLYSWLLSLRLEGELNPERPQDPDCWSATDKLSVLLQISGMGAAERAAYCERSGLSEQQLQRWRQAALQANEKPLLILRAEEELQRLRLRDQREIRRLKKELRRLERSASISAELLDVVRKLQCLWEQGEGS